MTTQYEKIERRIALAELAEMRCRIAGKAPMAEIWQDKKEKLKDIRDAMPVEFAGLTI